jgi:flagellar biosynthesis protein FlhF
MIVKKFEAPTENEAILKAKEELGSQAVVLNSKKRVPKGLFRLVRKESYEITAALEERDFIQDINKNKPTMPKKEGPKPQIDILADDEPTQRTIPSAVEKKVSDIHEILNNQFGREIKENRFHEFSGEEPVKEESDNANVKALKLIYNKLLESEVDEKYANSLIGEIQDSLKRESDVKSILAGVYQKIILRLGEAYDISNEGRPKVVVFIGPTGVGKTTTIAKIASKLKLTDHKRVALITADTYRISAVEQLNTYAEIIDVEIKVVYTPEEMTKAIRSFKEYDYILVDTAGRSHKNEEQIKELSEYLAAVKKVKTVDMDTILVLSATTKYKDLIQIVSSYDFADDFRLLFTKLDETSAYGNILNIKLQTGAGLTYFTMGQNVPDDIEKVNVQWLARQIIGGNE